MSETPKIMEATLTDAQFDALHNTAPGSQEATSVLEDIGANGTDAEVAIHIHEDELGYRTARYVGLTLAGQGDVFSLKTIDKRGLPSPSEALSAIAAKQASTMNTNNPNAALAELTAQPGAAGAR